MVVKSFFKMELDAFKLFTKTAPLVLTVGIQVVGGRFKILYRFGAVGSCCFLPVASASAHGVSKS